MVTTTTPRLNKKASRKQYVIVEHILIHSFCFFCKIKVYCLLFKFFELDFAVKFLKKRGVQNGSNCLINRAYSENQKILEIDSAINLN